MIYRSLSNLKQYLTHQEWRYIQTMPERTPSSTKKPNISLVIPTWNAEQTLPTLLENIQRQKQIGDKEIIVIDSGSTDRTVPLAKRYTHKVIRVPQKSFNHGLTRTQAAQTATHAYIFFLVQDAIPEDDMLFASLLTLLRSKKEIAAVSARQCALPNADIFAQWSTEQTYTSLHLDRKDYVFSLPEDTSFSNLNLYLQRKLSLLDNVCSAVRKDIFTKLGGFASLPLSEDTQFAMEALSHKYKIGFLGSRCIRHSHTRPPAYVLKRTYTGYMTQVQLYEGNLPTPFATWEELVGAFFLLAQEIEKIYHVEMEWNDRIFQTILSSPDTNRKKDTVPPLLTEHIKSTYNEIRIRYNKKIEQKEKRVLCHKIYAQTLGQHIARFFLNNREKGASVPHLQTVDRLLRAHV